MASLQRNCETVELALESSLTVAIACADLVNLPDVIDRLLHIKKDVVDKRAEREEREAFLEGVSHLFGPEAARVSRGTA